MAGNVTWLCTGSSRGIGLELIKQLASNPANIVIATCRTPEKATALQALKDSAKGSLHIVPLDINERASIDGVLKPIQEILGSQGLDYVVNVAAINSGNDSAFDFEYNAFMTTLQTNIVGTAYVSQVLYPLLEKGTRKTIVNYSSGLGSIGVDFGSRNATYSVSKTALSMLTYKQAKQRQDFIVIAVDPGWVKTDMGGPDAHLHPHESVEAVLKTIANLKPSDSGKLYRHDGTVLPW